MIHNLYKKRGDTPLECLEKYRMSKPELKDEKMTYLGRLDPMAEGVLLVASGEDIKQRENYLGLDKTYEFGVLIGFSTDSYDLLGKITEEEKVESVSEIDLVKIAQIYKGRRDQKFPKYSSFMIDHPEVESPIKQIDIYDIKFDGLDTLRGKELLSRINIDINKVNGNFRQEEILNLWKRALENRLNDNFFVANFVAKVSSGTYIRSIVNDMGKTLSSCATAFYIKRTQVGDYDISNSIT